VTPTNPKQSFRARLRGALLWPLLLPVELYRRFVSPLIAPRCRYYPTCSSYAVEALKTYGPIRGSILAAWRVMRCNPFSEGGFDAVEDQKLFAPRAAHEDCGKSHKHRHGVAT
jgi:putative membrane protein insertion efficiency factor